jgi:hypothetical protein
MTVEQFKVKLDAELFDSIIKNSLPEGGDLEAIIKPGATQEGRPCVMLTFTVELPDGTLGRAQVVVPSRLFVMAAVGVAGHHERLTGEKLI